MMSEHVRPSEPIPLFVLEHHHQLFELWQFLWGPAALSSEQQPTTITVNAPKWRRPWPGLTQPLNLQHIDFHCDMRGLLVRPAASQAAWSPRQPEPLDEGNFLGYAIQAGWLSSVSWVYPTPGGRRDDVGGVVLDSDLAARLPWRRPTSTPMAVDYQEQQLRDWPGPPHGCWLDLDWDAFASLDFPLASVSQRVQHFLDLLAGAARAKPQAISLCYSPGFSHPTRRQFREFADRLATIYDAQIVPLECRAKAMRLPSQSRFHAVSILRACLRHGVHQTRRWLRHRGIYL